MLFAAVLISALSINPCHAEPEYTLPLQTV